MTIDGAIIMLNAKAKCIDKKYICPDTDCDEDKCEDCELCYEQGTFGEQKSLMLFCAECLSELKELRIITKSDDGFTDSLINMGYVKGYKKAEQMLLTNINRNYLIDFLMMVCRGA